MTPSLYPSSVWLRQGPAARGISGEEIRSRHDWRDSRVDRIRGRSSRLCNRGDDRRRHSAGATDQCQDGPPDRPGLSRSDCRIRSQRSSVQFDSDAESEGSCGGGPARRRTSDWSAGRTAALCAAGAQGQLQHRRSADHRWLGVACRNAAAGGCLRGRQAAQGWRDYPRQVQHARIRAIRHDSELTWSPDA